MRNDTGARNVILMICGVAALVAAFYGYLGWRAVGVGSSVYFIQSEPPSRAGHASRGNGTETAKLPHPSVVRGRKLYLVAGCALCHGVDGVGQVKSPNYVKETMPALNVLAERMFLLAPEDAEAVIRGLDAGPLDANALDVPRAGAVAAQYASIREVIMVGNPGGKKDEAGPAPLEMPRWDHRLTASEVNDVIAYLLSVYPWEGNEPR